MIVDEKRARLTAFFCLLEDFLSQQLPFATSASNECKTFIHEYVRTRCGNHDAITAKGASEWVQVKNFDT